MTDHLPNDEKSMAIIQDMLTNKTIFNVNKVKEIFYSTTGNNNASAESEEDKRELLVCISKLFLKYKLVINFNDPEIMIIQEELNPKEKRVQQQFQQVYTIPEEEAPKKQKQKEETPLKKGEENAAIVYHHEDNANNGDHSIINNSLDDEESLSDLRDVSYYATTTRRKESTAKQQPSKSSGHANGKFLTSFIERLHHAIISGLVAISVCAAKNPMRTIAFVPTLSFALIIIGFMTNFNLDLGTLNTFAPFDALSVEHDQWINDPATGWNIGRPPFVIMLHNQGEQVIGKNELLWTFEAINIVRNTPGYDDICSLSDYVDPFQKKIGDSNIMMARNTKKKKNMRSTINSKILGIQYNIV